MKDTYAFASPNKTPEELAGSFVRFYEPAFETAQVGGKPGEFRNQLLELARADNRSTDGGTLIPARYVRITVSLWG